MLTPVNVQSVPQGSASTNTRSSDGDNGFGNLLNDTKARRQNDAGTSTASADTQTSAASGQQARPHDKGAEGKGSSLQANGASAMEGRRTELAGSGRHTLSSTLERLQGNRLEGRGPGNETSLQKGSDRTREALADQKTVEGTLQAGLAHLAGGRQSTETLNAERVGSKLSDKQAANRGDVKTGTADEKGKRLTDSESKDDASSLYALIDTGLLMQGSPAQKTSTGREGSLPTRGAMLEQGLRGRDSTALDGKLATLNGGDQESVRSDRLFGDILTRRDGLLSRAGEAGADKTSGLQTGATATHDSPLNTLSALTGQPGTQASMAVGTAQAVTTATLPAMDSDQWSSAFERQVINLSMRGGGEARLNMNPLELGPLSISLKMGEQSAQLHIASHHAQVRAAIEAALPQLRDAFSASGIELGQTSVSDQGSFQQGNFQQQQDRTPGIAALQGTSSPITGIDTSTEVISINALPGRSLNGGIDLFA